MPISAIASIHLRGESPDARIIIRDPQWQAIFKAFEKGELMRFMAKRVGQGEYEITSLTYDTSMFTERRPPVVPLPPIIGMIKRPPEEDCIAFDPNRIEVKKVRGRWKVIEAPDHWMFDTNGHRAEAFKILEVLRYYHIDEVCYVGRPHAPMIYLLSQGKPPRGAMPGEDCIPFDPEKLKVAQHRGRWKIEEDGHWLFDFGRNRESAEKGLEIIRWYGFTHSCFVGRPDPSLKYLRK